MPTSKLSVANAIQGEYVVSLYRYFIVFLFFLAASTSGMLWVTYAPIVTEASDYFKVSEPMVDLLALCYPATYIIGTFLATICFERYGMRGTFLIATGGMFVSASLRVIGSLKKLNLAPANGYAWALAGQITGGLVQPLILNSPAKLITRWFPAEQRDLFIAATSSFNILGSMIGQVISTYFVPDHGSFPALHLISSFWAGFVFILFVLFFENFPKYPPSLAALQHLENMHIPHAVHRYYYDCLTNFNFLLLFCGFGCGLALFNSIITLVGELTEPYHYSSDDAGMFALTFLLSGITAALLIGPILDHTHLYKTFLRLFSVLGFGAIWFLNSAMRQDNTTQLLISFGVFGFFVLPLLPIVIEVGVECTYPVPEEYSTGLLMASGNVISLPLVFLLDALNNNVNESDSGILSTDVKRVLVIIYGFGLSFLVAFNGEYRRLEQEQDNERRNLEALFHRRAGALQRAQSRDQTFFTV